MTLYLTYYLQFVAVFILLTWAMYLPMRAGQMYNGPVYCMAVGGYFAAFTARDLGWPFGLAIIVAVAVSALFGFLPALGLARTTGLPIMVASIALIFIIQSVIRNLDFLGGSHGFWNIPEVEYLLPITYGILLIVGILVFRIDRSRLGRAMEAARVDQDVAATLGVNLTRLSMLLQVISATIGGLAGVIFAFSLRTIFPETYGFSLLLYIWAMFFLGGRFTMWGPIIAVPILWGLPQWIPHELAGYSNIFYGALLVIIILLRPEGIISRGVVRRVSTSTRTWLRRLISPPKSGKEVI